MRSATDREHYRIYIVEQSSYVATLHSSVPSGIIPDKIKKISQKFVHSFHYFIIKKIDHAKKNGKQLVIRLSNSDYKKWPIT